VWQRYEIPAVPALDCVTEQAHRLRMRALDIAPQRYVNLPSKSPSARSFATQLILGRRNPPELPLATRVLGTDLNCSVAETIG